MALSRKTIVQAKVETTYATDPTVGTGDVRLVRNWQWTPNVTMYNRAVMSGSATPFRSPIKGQKWCSMSFSQYLTGSGLATPFSANTELAMSSVFLQGCGLSATHSADQWDYALLDSGFSGVSFEWNRDGVFYESRGAMGNAVLVFTPGAPVDVEYSFLGLWNHGTGQANNDSPYDAALITPDFSGEIDPALWISSGFDPWNTEPATVAAFEHCRSLRLDLRNSVSPRASGTVATHGVAAINLNPRGTADDAGIGFVMEIEAADDDYWAEFMAGTDSRTALSAASDTSSWGSVAGNVWTMVIYNMALSQAPEDITFDDGVAGYRLTGRLLGTSGGLDEWTLQVD